MAFTATLARIDDFARGKGAQQKVADFAARMRDQVIARDHPSSVLTVVDGRIGGALDQVKVPGGTIVFEFGNLMQALRGILAMVAADSPSSPKRANADAPVQYRADHIVLIDAEVVTELPASLAPNQIVQVVNIEPYAHKIEGGLSLQAPNGVYEVVAAMARAQWGDTLDISVSNGPLPDGIQAQGAVAKLGYPLLTIKAKQ